MSWYFWKQTSNMICCSNSRVRSSSSWTSRFCHCMYVDVLRYQFSLGIEQLRFRWLNGFRNTSEDFTYLGRSEWESKVISVKRDPGRDWYVFAIFDRIAVSRFSLRDFIKSTIHRNRYNYPIIFNTEKKTDWWDFTFNFVITIFFV